MKNFKLLLLLFVSLFLLSACSSTPQQASSQLKICPQCNMELPDSNIHTAILTHSGEKEYFDDPGCMILWAKKSKINLEKSEVEIFSNDTKKYIDAKGAFYKIDEKTPMLYGFSAYEENIDNSINFDEVTIRMLRGEHMANPKIRKHILGY